MPTQSSPPAPTPFARPQTILVVDDERDILDSLNDLFTASLPGVRVLTAESGEAALKVLGAENVDLVVSDYKMPGMNGLQFLEKARQAAPQVPRIMMTAFPDLEIAVAAINHARIETFFTKPLDPDKVIGVVEQTLQARRAKGDRDLAMSRAFDQLRRKGGT